MKNAFIKGAITITIATFLSKLLGSFLQIPLQNIAGDEVVGIFKLVYPVYMIALTLSVAGIPLAISKLISEARAQNNERDIQHIFKTASLIALTFGLISFVIMVFFSKPLAIALGSEATQLAIILISTTLIAAPYMAVYRGYFQGFEDMRPTAYSQVLEQFIRVAVTLTIAYLLVQQAAPHITVASWIMLGSIAGVIFSLLYLLVTYWKFPKVKTTYTKREFSKWAKTILKTSLPIAVGALTLALLQLVDSFTVPHALTKHTATEEEIHRLFGIYSGRGLSLVQIAVVFSSAIILPLIPLLSKKILAGAHEANAYIKRSFTFAHIVSWPVAVGLAVLVWPINLTLFTDLAGSSVIAILGVSSLFSSYTVLTTGILQGINRSMHVAGLLVLVAVCKAILNVVLVSQLGINGAGWATLFTYFLLTVIHLIWIKKETGFTLNIKEMSLIAASSIVMGIAVASPLFFFDVSAWSRLGGLLYLLVAVPLGAVLYAGLLFLTKVATKEMLRKFDN